MLNDIYYTYCIISCVYNIITAQRLIGLAFIGSRFFGIYHDYFRRWSDCVCVFVICFLHATYKKNIVSRINAPCIRIANMNIEHGTFMHDIKIGEQVFVLVTNYTRKYQPSMQ